MYTVSACYTQGGCMHFAVGKFYIKKKLVSYIHNEEFRHEVCKGCWVYECLLYDSFNFSVYGEILIKFGKESIEYTYIIYMCVCVYNHIHI